MTDDTMLHASTSLIFRPLVLRALPVYPRLLVWPQLLTRISPLPVGRGEVVGNKDASLPSGCRARR